MLWSVRTVDCYSRFDAADAEPKRNYFNGRSQKRRREKGLIIFLFTDVDSSPRVINGD